MHKRTRKTILLLAKLIVAAVLLGWVISQVHWHDYVQTPEGKTYSVGGEVDGNATGPIKVMEGPWWASKSTTRPISDFKPVGPGQIVRPGFATSLGRIKVGLAASGASMFGLALLMIAVRWRMLLRIVGVRVSLWEATRLTFLGQFFNSIVPGTVGGDLVKAYYVSRHTPKKAAVIVSIFVDRLLGLIELALMAGVMLLGLLLGIGPEAGGEDLALPATCVAVILPAVAGMMLFLLSQRFRRFFHLSKIYQRLPIAHHIEAAGDAAVRYRQNLGAMVGAVGISAVSHLAFVSFVALIGMSLSMPVGWMEYFLYVPLIYIIGAIPLTPGGVGWVENWYVRFFESPVCGASTILVLALLARLVPMLWGLPGAIVAVTGPRVPKAEDIEAELAAAEAQQTEADPTEPGQA